MYAIKTVTTLIKCLNLDIPIYHSICNIEMRIPRIAIFKMSLIEVTQKVRLETFYTKMSKEAIVHYSEVLEEEKKAKNALIQPIVFKAPATVII